MRCFVAIAFLAACGPAFTTDQFSPGDASAPEDRQPASTSESSLETSATATTTSTDATFSHGISESSTTEASLPSTRPTTDAGYEASSDAQASTDCNLTCEPMCIRLMMPMHACCSPRQQCHCTTAVDAGPACGF